MVSTTTTATQSIRTSSSSCLSLPLSHSFLVSCFSSPINFHSSSVAGYPLIYHHVRALAEISQVRNVFLVGRYQSSAFNFFIESLYDEFSFQTVQYIHEDQPNNEAGILFRHREQLMENDPEYFFCLRYKICSSFPLQQMISFHKKKEQDAENSFLERKKLLEVDGGASSLTKLKKLKIV